MREKMNLVGLIFAVVLLGIGVHIATVIASEAHFTGLTAVITNFDVTVPIMTLVIVVSWVLTNVYK
jgi:uncharacterized membrane protein (DUF485 family)